jgi:hypothetical protein
MNDIARMNGLVYGLYWLQEIHQGTTEPVTIQPDGGTFAQPITVTLSCPTPGAAIRYTLDGSEPTARSPEYRSPLTVSRNSTLKAAAIKAGLRPRSVSQAAFTLGGPPFSRERLELWLRADAGVSVSLGRSARASAPQESEGPGEERGEVPQRGESEAPTPRSLPDARNPRLEIVTRWADQSGNGRHAQASGDRAPAFAPDGPGNHPVVRGDNGLSMTLRRLVPLPDDCTFLFVGSFTGNSSAVVGDGDDGWFGMRELGPGEFTVRFSVGERGFNARLRSRYEPGRFAVWSVIRKGGRVTIYRNGQRATERADYPSDGSTMNLGLLMGMRPRNVNLKGDLAELLVFSRALSDDHRAGIERYLTEKYGPWR